MINVMIDIETLGLENDAVITSIGAVIFNENGVILEEFYCDLNIQEQLNKGRTVTAYTLQWYLENNLNFKIDITEDLIFVLGQFHNWLKSFHVNRVWANGVCFDIVKLESLFKQYYPCSKLWEFWQVNDLRTIVSLYPECRQTINTHNALEDAKNQVQWLMKASELSKEKGFSL